MATNKKPEFKCPICGGIMKTVPGNLIDVKNGVTIFCDNNADAGCLPYENVFGHGKTEADAYDAAKAMYKKPTNS